MIRIEFDAKKPYRVVVYVRMSSELQNARSPDQQVAEIKRRLRAMGYTWIIVGVYRDDAVSGRFVKKRPEFNRMLRDLKSGAVKADLILVDTYQRFGRAEELDSIRKDLKDHHGILVVTANSNFANPDSSEGRALGMVDSFVATEENRVKAHNVSRGKRDAAELKHWPGGTASFGFQLQSVMKTEKGRQVVDYSVLVPHPEESQILRVIFREADATGFGQTRLTRHLNKLSEIPDKYKPFRGCTLARWLRNELYIGVLSFGKLASDIVRDTTVRRRNPESEIQRVEGFCESIIDPEVFQRVKAMFDARSARHKKLNPSVPSEKLIAPLIPGLAVKYLLSGLVFCSHCKARMTASSSSEYEPASGDKRRYVKYVCSAYREGNCPNGKSIPESWLRQVVINRLRERLFPL